MPSSCSDWAEPRKSPKAFTLAWGLPGLLVLVATLVPISAPFLYPLGMLWIGASCLINAKRCGRTHCFLTGPLSIVFAAVAIAKGFGIHNLAWYHLLLAYAVLMTLSFMPEWLGKKYIHKS